MHIAINALLISGEFSGVQHSIVHQMRALLHRAAGHHFSVLALADVPIETHLGATAADYSVLRTPLRSGQRLQRIFWEQAMLPHLLRAQGVDLLYSPGYLTPLRWHGPAVVYVHDTIALSHPRLCTRSNAWNYQLLLPPSARHATLVATPSAASAHDVTHYCRVAPEQIRVVPHGVVIPSMPTAAEIVHQRAAFDFTAPFLLAVSTIEPKKNFASLIRWFDAWKSAGIPHHLVIVGKWGWGCAEVRRALAHAQARAQIHLVGYVPQSEMPAIMAAADLLLIPSLYEGFGLPALEAMAVGTPVVASDRGGLPEAMGGAGVILPLDDALWQAEIPNLLRRPRQLAMMRMRGQTHAAAMTWEHSAELLLAAFEEAVEGVPVQRELLR